MGDALKTVHGASIGWQTGWHCYFHGSFAIHGHLLIQRVQGDSYPTSLPCMAGKSTSYGSFMPASNTPTCDFKILMTLRTCSTPSELGYHVSVVLFCVILLISKDQQLGGTGSTLPDSTLHATCDLYSTTRITYKDQ